jgi:dolichol-phosphate mannosyltransferase
VLAGRTIAVVIPARNEEERVAEVVTTLPAFVDVAVVIDDASTDNTARAAREAGAVVLQHETRRGVGAAISTGYEHARSRGFDIAVVMAGDGQMDPLDLAALLQPILDGEADYVKGNRFRHPAVDSTMPRARFHVGRALSLMTRVATGAAVSDTQCGYTAITREALVAIEACPMWVGYGYPNDLIGILARHGQRVREVVVRPVYRGEKSGLRPWHVAIIVGIITRSGVLRLEQQLGLRSRRQPLERDLSS